MAASNAGSVCCTSFGFALPRPAAPASAPPLRDDAPQPIGSRSSTTGFAPPRVSSSAVDSPAMPPPMITTSAVSGMAVERDTGGASSHQNGRSTKPGARMASLT